METTAAAGGLAELPQQAMRFFTGDAAGAHGLDAGERDRFERTGWTGVYPLLTAAGVEFACRTRERVIARFMPPESLPSAQDPAAFKQRPWFKSLHAHVPYYYDIARHPAIVGRVVSVLGPDVLAWGLTMIRAVPGRVHRWHVDVEHRHWHGVSVYLGLEGIDIHSTLKVLEGSHRLDELPQALGVDDDAEALAAAQERVPGARVLPVPLEPGQFFLFAGRLWHASHNTGPRVRTAMIIHYSRPDAPVRVPLNFTEPVQWHPTPPPCVLVSGSDRHGVNRLVGPPGSGRVA
jgi:hypothetical protein